RAADEERYQADCDRQTQERVEHVLTIVEGDDQSAAGLEYTPQLAKTTAEIGGVAEVVECRRRDHQRKASRLEGQTAGITDDVTRQAHEVTRPRARHDRRRNVHPDAARAVLEHLRKEAVGAGRLLEEIRLEDASARRTAPARDQFEVR